MPENSTETPFFDRELSWLAFNGRVLQEASDPSVPLIERLRFLAIFSSNLDEFFRVRVATLRTLLRLKSKKLDRLDVHPARLLQQIHRIVAEQQERFGKIFRHEIIPGLEEEGIVLLDEKHLSEMQRALVRAYLGEVVRPHLHPEVLRAEGDLPFLENHALYLVTELWPHDSAAVAPRAGRFGLVEIPSEVPRFMELPEEKGPDGVPRRPVIFLDDIIRLGLDGLFPDDEVGEAYAFKLSRDAELYVNEADLGDEFSGSLAEAIRHSLKKRETGAPTRFLYDLRAPYPVIAFLKKRFGLADEDLVMGGRYHHFSDFWSFPTFGRDDLLNEPLPPLPHPVLGPAESVMDATRERDHLLHVPYHDFEPVLRLLNEAAEDPDVEAIYMTLYRVGATSVVPEPLIRAAEAGKQVTAFVEVKARFDEAPNLAWADRMEAAGVRVLYSMPGLKVHAKLILVDRRETGAPELEGTEPDAEGRGIRRYAYLSTGNFNEKNATIYGDHGLFTADSRLTTEVRRVFEFLERETPETDDAPHFEHLLVAPFTMRDGFYRLLEGELENHLSGRPAGVMAKMNALEDEDMIERLYDAAQKGLPLRMVVRGVCCLVTEQEGLSEGVEVTSIVDRFLEHARVYRFERGGDPVVYLASADWMNRNLSNRVEVAFPLYDERLRAEVEALLKIQLRDNQKARRIDAKQRNRYVEEPGAAPLRAQTASYRYVQSLGESG